MKRSTPVNRFNLARRRREFVRAYGSKERVAFVGALQCCLPDCRTGSIAAHIGNGGMGRKADAQFVVPACPACHADLHQYGIGSDLYSSLLRIAQDTQTAWERHCDHASQ